MIIPTIQKSLKQYVISTTLPNLIVFSIFLLFISPNNRNVVSILGHLGKIPKLKNRSNYQSWKSTLEGILELEGLWKIVNGELPKPSDSTAVQPSVTSPTSTEPPNANPLDLSDITPVIDAKVIQNWTVNARRASIIIDLSISNELRHISKNFSKDDPVGLWKHLEKKFQPDTATEASRLYRQLLEIEPKEDETAEKIIE